MDSGFFISHGFDEELDPGAFENTALNNLDPIREAELFEEFEQDYRSGGYDPGPERGRASYRPAYRPTDSGYHDAADSGYRSNEDQPDDYRADHRPRHGKPRDRRHGSEGGPRIPLFARRTNSTPKATPKSASKSASKSAQRPRRPSGGRQSAQWQPAQGQSAQGQSAQWPTRGPAQRPRSASVNRSPFGELGPYLVPILVAVVIVMVIVVLLLNR
jgi:hypothetical protein